MNKCSNIVAGIDEAGRGPLFGPVVACSVIFKDDVNVLGITDSKKISTIKRQSLYAELIADNIDYGIGIVNENVIDKINILNATKKAMLLSVENLQTVPDKLLIDGNQLIETNLQQEAIVKGDQKIAEISAASIIAKVTRDNIINSYDKIFPMFGLSRHKGYGTKKHIESIYKYGSTSIHRKTFRPVSNVKVQNMQDYESCDIVQYALNLVKLGLAISYFNNKEDVAIAYEDNNCEIYSMFVDNGKDNIDMKIVNEIKEKDSILNKRLDVIYIDNGNAKIIKSCQI